MNLDEKVSELASKIARVEIKVDSIEKKVDIQEKNDKEYNTSIIKLDETMKNVNKTLDKLEKKIEDITQDKNSFWNKLRFKAVDKVIDVIFILIAGGILYYLANLKG